MRAEVKDGLKFSDSRVSAAPPNLSTYDALLMASRRLIEEGTSVNEINSIIFYIEKIAIVEQALECSAARISGSSFSPEIGFSIRQTQLQLMSLEAHQYKVFAHHYICDLDRGMLDDIWPLRKLSFYKARLDSLEFRLRYGQWHKGSSEPIAAAAAAAQTLFQTLLAKVFSAESSMSLRLASNILADHYSVTLDTTENSLTKKHSTNVEPTGQNAQRDRAATRRSANRILAGRIKAIHDAEMPSAPLSEPIFVYQSGHRYAHKGLHERILKKCRNLSISLDDLSLRIGIPNNGFNLMLRGIDPLTTTVITSLEDFLRSNSHIGQSTRILNASGR